MPSLPIVTINFISNSLLNVNSSNFRFSGLRETTKIVPNSKSVNSDLYKLNVLYLTKKTLFEANNLSSCETINDILVDVQKYRFRIFWRTINGS